MTLTTVLKLFVVLGVGLGNMREVFKVTLLAIMELNLTMLRVTILVRSLISFLPLINRSSGDMVCALTLISVVRSIVDDMTDRMRGHEVE